MLGVTGDTGRSSGEAWTVGIGEKKWICEPGLAWSDGRGRRANTRDVMRFIREP